MFTRALDAQLKQHAQNASYSAVGAKTKREAVGRVAADWELEDLMGGTHILQNYRGRMVVLDFWYRGCGRCIRAMPQMKPLADDFRGQPVAILGLNTDPDVKDVRFVAGAMGLNYPTLVSAEMVPGKCHVRVFPTPVVIDPQGNVAKCRVGYSTDLRAAIGEVIRRLLPAAPAADPPTRAR